MSPQTLGFVRRQLQSLPIMLIAMSLATASSCLCSDAKQQMTAAVDAVQPALIRIHVVATDYRQGREAKTESAGSGVIISEEGYAVTNHHVAMDAERMFCTLADRREIEAKLIGTDPMADIAVIKLISPDNKPFPTASFGDSSKLEVGDRVFAMGCPYALSQSVTMGIVSNTQMIMPDFARDEDFTLEGEDVGSIVRWIGHDALIAPGNSGGPLVNEEGKIVGINEIEMGLSGAIPSNLAREVAEQIIKNGHVTRSWLGMDVQPLLDSSHITKGILVCGVLDDSPAKKAGFKSGDVLLSLDGHNVLARFKEEIPIFNQFVADIPVGKTVDAKVMRDGVEATLSITTAERPKAQSKEHEIRSWGICASDITYLMQKEMQLDSHDGVYVTGVLPSGPGGSAKPPLREGDVIVTVGNEPVANIARIRSVTKELLDGHDEGVSAMVLFNRDKKLLATVVKLGKSEESEVGREVKKAWLAVDTQVITRELAEALDIPDKTGVRVTQVYKGSSADKAGLKVGDLIIKLDGDAIPAEQMGDEEVLPSLIRQYDIGAEVKLGIIRGKKAMEITVKLEVSPTPTRDYPKYEDPSFEFSARDIAFDDRTSGNVSERQTGVFVDAVSEGSWAALGGLRTGDVIAEIDGAQVVSLDQLKAQMAELSIKKPKAVVFRIVRGIHTAFLEMKPSWPESDL